jgi:hypothetical protein
MPQAPYTIMRYRRTMLGIDRRQAAIICSYTSMQAAMARCMKLNEPFTDWHYEVVALPEQHH